jgi:hypothetical protein
MKAGGIPNAPSSKQRRSSIPRNGLFGSDPYLYLNRVLGISVKTAETHRANIMRKLEMHSVNALVRYAVQHHMIEP